MKCKFWKRCEEYEKEGYTCNHEEDADGYCGIRTKGKFSNKLLTIFLLGIFMFSFASAWQDDSFIKDDEKIKELNTKTNYGTYTIEESKWYDPLQIWTKETIKEVTLKDNSDVCGINCYAIKEIKNLEEGSLIDDIRFYKLDGEESRLSNIRNYQFYINTKGEKIEVNDYEGQCNKIGISKNGTIIKECSNVLIGTHNIDAPDWTRYKLGNIMPKGTYEVKLIGEKRPEWSYDWQVLIGETNTWTEAWAVWGNISEGDDAEVILNSPADEAIAYTFNQTFNCSAEIVGGANIVNMSLWTNESGNWEVKNTTIIVSNFSNVSNLISYYKLDENAANTDVVDSKGSNNGIASTNTNNLYDASGKINSAFDFEYDNTEYVGLGNTLKYGKDDSYSISSWVKIESNGGGSLIIFGNSQIGAPYTGMEYGVDRNNNKFYMQMVGTWPDYCKGYVSVTLNNNQWYHLVVTFPGTNQASDLKFYIDGDLKTTTVENASSASSTIGLIDSDIGTRAAGNSSSFDGLIDEFGIWNKVLSQAEVTELYNSGNGAYPQENIINSSTQTFNRTLTGDTLWSCQACDSDGVCGFALENRTLFIDSAEPNITVQSPTGTYDYNVIGESETLNITFTDTNLESCWYNYNGTNTTIDGCLSGIKNSTTFILEEGNLNMTIYANDSIGNLASEFVSWDYYILENSFTFNNETRAGDQEDFTLNLTLKSGLDLTSATFMWNGLEVSPGIFSSGQNRILTIEDYAIALYQVNTNVSIYFNLILDDATEINTTNETQLVYAIFLDNCSVYTNQLFNISLFDEELKTPLLGDIEFNYELLNVPDYNKVNSLNMSFTNKSNIAICSDINLTEENFVQSVEIRYVSDGYAPELYHIQRAAITDETVILNLFDLNESDSTEFKITYQDSTFNFVEGAVVQLQRKYISEGIYETVEAPLTSNDGVAIVHIDLDTVKYRATIVKDGVVLDEFDNLVFKCQSELTGECEQKLLGTIDPQNNIDLDTTRDFSYSINRDENVITLSFTIPSGTSSAVNMQMTQKDQFGSDEMCNRTITSSAGSLQCTFNDTIGDSYIDLRVYKNEEPMAIQTYIIPEVSGVDFLGNNYIIIVVLLLSIVGMALTSPEWIIINGIIVMVIAGALWLANGLNFVMGLGSLMWLIIAAGIIIFKLAKQEDK